MAEPIVPILRPNNTQYMSFQPELTRSVDLPKQDVLILHSEEPIKEGEQALSKSSRCEVSLF
jgi:hypothetical protein